MPSLIARRQKIASTDPRRAEQVPDGGLGRRHRDALAGVAEHALEGPEFDLSSPSGVGRAVSIDVVDLGRRDPGTLQGRRHAAVGAVAILGGVP